MADADTDIATQESIARAERKATRRRWLGRLALVVIAATVIWLLWYVLLGRNHVSTDNA